MRFNTKKDLLRYLGKNEDDRKLVDRMVARGEVEYKDRVYIVEDNSDKIKKLEDDLNFINWEYIKIEESREKAIRKCYDLMVDKKIFDPEKNTFEEVFNRAISE